MGWLLAGIFIMSIGTSAFAYVGKMERREGFFPKMMCCIGLFFAVAAVCGGMFYNRFDIIQMLLRVAGMPVLFLAVYHCFKLSPSLSLYYSIWSFISWHFMCELWLGLNALFRYMGITFFMQEIVSALFIFAVGNLLIRLTLARWMPEDSKERLGPRQLISAVVIFSAFEIISYMTGENEMVPGEGKWLIVYLAQMLLILLLYLQSELFKKSAMRQELAVMNMLWKKKQEQYELSRENIALINQKCHDLKHQIRAIRSMKKEEIDSYLEEMEESVKIYESIVKTGNEVLDTILTEKSLYCKERGITISCVADGSQMEFINAIDLYAILGNALDNAIEAVEKFRHEEKRQIDVMIYRQQQFLVIHIVNPVKERLVFEEDLPRTTKQDKFYHGFGLKSIRYMVKKYDGNVNVSVEDGCFSLKILIPVP